MNHKFVSGPVGLIGLGIIGSRVAHNLERAGIEVWVWNRTPRMYPRFLGSPGELAARVDILQIFVKDGPALLECVREMLPHLSPRHILLNHATVHPDEAREAGRLVASKGTGFLDAPFTGSRDAAQDGTLVYYVGGSESLLERVRSLLLISGKSIIPVGDIGDASLLKVATNMVTASIVTALAEALALIEANGLSGKLLEQALAENAARSGVADMKLPTMLSRDFEPRFSLENMAKDMRIASKLLKAAGIPAHAVAAFLNHAELSVARGDSSRDFSVIVEACRKG